MILVPYDFFDHHSEIEVVIPYRSEAIKIMPSLTLIYPAHFEDVPCQSGVNHIFEG